MAVGSTLDPYAALGVPHDAAPAALRSAYKKLMLQCHPDKVRDEDQRAEKAQQFQKVQEAYELLIDPRRRRKYDEELTRKGPAAAQAAAASGGPNGAKPTPSANPASGGDDGVKKERKRRQDDKHRRPREDASFETKDRDERQYQRRHRKGEDVVEEAMRASERAQYEREQRYKEQHQHQQHQQKHSSSRHAHVSSTTNRYASADEPPPMRKASYERAPPPQQQQQQQHVPRPPPPPPPSSRPPHPQPEPRGPPSETDTEKPAVRPGYEETRAAEDAKLEAVRRRLREAQAGPGAPRTHRSNSHEEDPYTKAQFRQQQADRIAREKAEARKARQAAKEQLSDHSERLGRPTEIPTARPRKGSASPMGRRRGSSSVSRDDFAATPPFAAKPPMFGGSVPTPSAFYATPPHLSTGHPQVRRRHSVSSPSLEKQNSRLQRDQQQQAPCDSGYSSPSSPNHHDTTPSFTFEKNVSSNLSPSPSPAVPKADGSTIHPRDSSAQSTPGWKKFIVYVQEDGEAPAVPIDGRRKASSSGTGGSPDLPHAEPVLGPEGPPLPPDFFVKAAGSGLAGGSTFFVTSTGLPPPGAYGPPLNYAGSHAGSQSSHSSPRQPIRHHSVHYHPHPSPKMAEPTFPMPSPQLSRASTTAGPTRRTAASEMPYGSFQAPVFTRGGTWGP